MEIADSSETSVTTFETTAYHNFNFHCRENIKIKIKTSIMTSCLSNQKSNQESSKHEEKMTTYTAVFDHTNSEISFQDKQDYSKRAVFNDQAFFI
jgi:hypothetical protein